MPKDNAYMRRYREGRGSSSGKGNASGGGSVSNAPAIEPLDKNSQVSKFMDAVLVKPDTVWTRIMKKEDSTFILATKDVFIDYGFVPSIRNITNPIRGISSEESKADVLGRIKRILFSSTSDSPLVPEHMRDPAYINVVKQWKNYLENYKK